MTVQLIQTSTELMTLREDWNALLRQSRSDCVFLTHEWLATWWRHLGGERKLSVIIVREDDMLVGLAPLALCEADYARMMPKRLEFIGSGIIGSDYLDLIVKPGRESVVFEELSAYLTKTGLMIQFGQLCKGSAAAEEFAAQLLSRNWTRSDTKINVCPFIELTGHTWESYLSSLGSSQRYNFNRRLKNLIKRGMRLECTSSPGDAQHALDVVIALHMKRWEGKQGESEAFQTPEITAFHQDFVQHAAEQGWLRLLTLWLDEVPVAALYGLRYGKTFYFYQSGFDPALSKQSVGLVMMGLAIKMAVEEGASEYDFLHGDEEYKFHWSRQTRELGRLELFPPHARARIYRRAIDVNRAARKMVRRVLP